MNKVKDDDLPGQKLAQSAEVLQKQNQKVAESAEQLENETVVRRRQSVSL